MMANETPLHTVLVLVTNVMTWAQAPHTQQITSQTSDNKVYQQH